MQDIRLISGGGGVRHIIDLIYWYYYINYFINYFIPSYVPSEVRLKGVPYKNSLMCWMGYFITFHLHYYNSRIESLLRIHIKNSKPHERRCVIDFKRCIGVPSKGHLLFLLIILFSGRSLRISKSIKNFSSVWFPEHSLGKI